MLLLLLSGAWIALVAALLEAKREEGQHLAAAAVAAVEGWEEAAVEATTEVPSLSVLWKH